MSKMLGSILNYTSIDCSVSHSYTSTIRTERNTACAVMPRSAYADIFNGGSAAYATPIQARSVNHDRRASDPVDIVSMAHTARKGSTANTSKRCGAGVHGEIISTYASIYDYQIVMSKAINQIVTCAVKRCCTIVVTADFACVVTISQHL